MPFSDALVRFGLQAHVSIAEAGANACGPRSRAVVGRFTPSEALALLMAGSRCRFRVIDPITFRVDLNPPPAPRPSPAEPIAPPPRPAPPAPPAPVAATDELLDLVVTANKRSELTSRTPASLSAATQGEIAGWGVQGLSDLAPLFAGVNSTNLGPGRNKLFVRGFSDGAFTGRTRSTVGLYLDDVPITYNAPDPDLRLVDVDQVEVLRGPQGTLYGVGSLGGILRIVTRKPDLREPGFWASVTGSATKDAQPSAAAEATINLPLMADRVAIRVSGYSESDGGYIDDLRLGVTDSNRTMRQGGRAALAMKLGPNWSLDFGGAVQSLRSNDTQYVGARRRLARANFIAEPHSNDFAQSFATVAGQGAWGRLQLSSSYISHTFESRYDATMALPRFGEIGEIGRVGAFDDLNSVHLLVGEGLYTSPPGRFEWLLGVFASHTVQSGFSSLDTVPALTDRPVYSERRRDHLGELSVYGEAAYALNRKLKLTLGLRVFRSRLRVASRVEENLESSSVFNGADHSADVAPKLVAAYQANPSTLFYAQAAEGYRVGGFNTSGPVSQRFATLAGEAQPSRFFAPDRLWSVEIGTRTRQWRDRIELRTALYYGFWNHIQSDQFLPTGLPFTANVGNGVNRGVEVEASYLVRPGLTVRLNLLGDSPELTKRDPTYPSRRRASLPSVPNLGATAIVDYRFPLGGVWAAALHAHVSYVSGSHLTFDVAPSNPMGNYVTGRLSASLEHRQTHITAFVDNPSNTLGDTFAFGNPFSFGRSRQVTPLRPRTVGVTLAVGY